MSKVVRLLAWTIVCSTQLITSCGPTPRKHDIQAAIKQDATVGNAKKIDVCGYATFDYDQIILLGPYATPSLIKQIDLRNYYTIRSIVNAQSASEGQTTLLYVKDHTCIAYSTVERSVLDLSVLTGTKSYVFLDRTRCEFSVDSLRLK